MAALFAAKRGQGQGRGSTSLESRRISRFGEPLRSRTWEALLATPDGLAAVQLDTRSLALFNAGGQVSDRLGKSQFAFAAGLTDNAPNYEVVARGHGLYPLYA